MALKSSTEFNLVFELSIIRVIELSNIVICHLSFELSVRKGTTGIPKVFLRLPGQKFLKQ